MALVLGGTAGFCAQDDGKGTNVIFNTTLSAPIAVFNQVDTISDDKPAKAAGAGIGVAGKTDTSTLKVQNQSNISTLELQNNATLTSSGNDSVPKWETNNMIIKGGGNITGKNLGTPILAMEPISSNAIINVNGEMKVTNSSMVLSTTNVGSALNWGGSKDSFTVSNPKPGVTSAGWPAVKSGDKTFYPLVLGEASSVAKPVTNKYALVDSAQVTIQLNASKCAARDILSVSHWNPNGIYAEVKSQGASIYCNYKPGNESDPYCTTYAGDIGLGANVCYGKSLSLAKLAHLVGAVLNRAAQITDSGSTTWTGGKICYNHFRYDLGINDAIGVTTYDMSGGTCQTKGTYSYQVEGPTDAALSGQEKQCLRRSWWDKSFKPKVTCGVQVKITCKLYQCQ